MTTHETNPWGSSLDKLKEWDSKGTEPLLRVGTNPWTSGVLPRKEVELISLALNCACTNLDEAGTRRHIRGALDAGATREEILTVFKMASLLALHSCSLGAPILLEEAKAAGVEPRSKNKVPTPVCDKAREIGQWNTAWDPFFNLDPLWTEQVMTAGLPVYTGALIPPKLAELLSIAFDASYTHMYAPGTRRHIKAFSNLRVSSQRLRASFRLTSG
jgi:alkylhydroperoxidase/carboxymuconolactone decarboxylase family protein YurZ